MAHEMTDDKTACSERHGRAYDILRSELSTTDKGSEILSRLYDAMAVYVSKSARDAAMKKPMTAEQELAAMVKVYDEARTFISENTDADVSALHDEPSFLEELAGHTIRTIMEKRAP